MLTLEEITFSELLPLFEKSFLRKISQGEEYNCSLSYATLLHKAKNTSANSCFIFIEIIKEKITTRYSLISESWPDNIRTINTDKFARLIESLGDYVIKETSSTELKTAYLRLIELFLNESYFNYESKIERMKSMLGVDHFENLAIKFLHCLPYDLSDIPCLTFNVIFELKKFPEHCGLVSGIIEKIMESSHCSLNNFLKIGGDDVRSYFLIELANRPDASFNFEEISKVLTFLTEKKDIFLNDIKNSLKLIEIMISKMSNDSPKKARILELVEVFFNSVQRDLQESNNSYRATYEVIMKGFLLYLKARK